MDCTRLGPSQFSFLRGKLLWIVSFRSMTSSISTQDFGSGIFFVVCKIDFTAKIRLHNNEIFQKLAVWKSCLRLEKYWFPKLSFVRSFSCNIFSWDLYFSNVDLLFSVFKIQRTEDRHNATTRSEGWTPLVQQPTMVAACTKTFTRSNLCLKKRVRSRIAIFSLSLKLWEAPLEH